MKNVLYAVGSVKISIVLFLLFAFFCAIATFIESSYDTPTAWVMVYGSAYFALIQLLLGINLACAIWRYKMISAKKIPLLVFHLSFLCILLGAAMTRYLGFEGYMHIRENASSATINSSKSFVKFAALKDNTAFGEELNTNIALLPFANNFTMRLNFAGENATLKYKNLLLNVEEIYKDDPQSAPMMVLMINTKNEGVNELVLGEGDIVSVDGVNFAFLNDSAPKPFVKINKDLQVVSSENLGFMSMQTSESANLKPLQKANASEKRLYSYKDMNFVIKYASLGGKIELKGKNRPEDNSFFKWFASLVFGTGEKLVLDKDAINALELTLSYKGESKDITIFEHAKPTPVDIAGQIFFVSYSAVSTQVPFELYLKDFVLDRYPGSMSPSSYASEVEVRDGGTNFDYRIFMNNVLDYKGYRFYQSSYDQDEKGTILSVNKDPGKIPTYIGYFLLMLGMFLSLLNPNSRFRTLAKLINQEALKVSAKDGAKAALKASAKATTKVSAVLLALAFLSLVAPLQAQPQSPHLSQQKEPPIASKEHGAKIATLVVQKNSGRMTPFDTLAGEILEKVYKNTTYKGKDANAVVLSMFIFKEWWAFEPIIIMPRQKAVNEEFAKILGLNEPKKYIRYADFFDSNDNYKLQKYVENANRKNPNARGVFDKEIIKLDERANIVNLVLGGDLLKLFPMQSKMDNIWLAPSHLDEAKTRGFIDNSEGEEVAMLFGNYINASILALIENNYTKADAALELIKEYQKKYGADIMPRESKINTEIFVNHAQIFVKLTPVYLLAGVLLLVLVLFKMLAPKANINIAFKFVYVLTIFAFVALSAGLILRGYIAEHAPWSNAYESMIYIAWALGLSGLLFSRKSPVALSLTSILAGLVLWVAHLGEMDPQITNLVPVLDSYWLSIHVSVITASYGFLGLCTLLGIFVLVLLCFMKKDGKHNQNIQRNITEATRINEMAMILGLILLTIGNFLGAIWANESWGRYWSWDSKETWALISILIYAAVLHIRLIPSLSNQYIFATASMFAYWSIIMTYFGVNYFLVGMHSYASGDVTQIPNSVLYSFILMLILAIISFFKRQYARKL